MTTTWTPPGPGVDPELDAAVAEARRERQDRLDAQLERTRVGSSLDDVLGRIPASAVEAARTGQLEDPRLTAAAELRARREEVYAQAWEACLPSLYATRTLDTLEPQQRPADLAAWVADERFPRLTLYGPSRHGKTAAMWATLRLMREQGLWVIGFTAADLAAAARPGGDERIIRSAEACDVLGIDDLGREVASDWWRERLHALLDRRATQVNRRLGEPVRQRRMIVTTNLEGDAAAKAYGDPIVNRIRERATRLRIEGRPLGAVDDW